MHGAVWSEANDFAMKLANQEGAALIHPFDDPEVRTLKNTLAIINRASDLDRPHYDRKRNFTAVNDTSQRHIMHCKSSLQLSFDFD